MSDAINEIVATAINNQKQSIELMEKLFTVAQPGVIYSEPVQAEGYTVITASEVSVSMGFGFGSGGGVDAQAAAGDVAVDSDAPAQETPAAGGGGGGGGGGTSTGRPVAVISIGENGVHVEPVVDPTKIALAFFTTLGTMFLMRRKMRKGGHG